jgi:hypothetical protein
VSWDEQIQREIGIVSFDYIAVNDHKLDTYIERDHGAGFEIVLIFIERTLHLEDSSDIYLMRHLASNLFFLVACFFGYILCYRLFRNNVIACIGFLMFVFHPRIYAHSYFNTKDLPFLSMILISLAMCQLAFDKSKWHLFLLAGAACGYASSIRLLGIMLACIIGVLLLSDLVSGLYKKQRARKHVVNLLSFVAGYCILLYIAFPTLWASPVANFIEVFNSLSHFRWKGNVFFQGQGILADELPWYYLPVWMGITTPIVWLLAGVIGFVLISWHVIRHPEVLLQNTRTRYFVICLGCFILPILSVIFLKSVVYDDWRHVYFVYPAFVILMLYAIEKGYKSKLKIIVVSIVAIQFVTLGWFMYGAHPNHQVYFNKLESQQPEELRHKYDLDYWACSFKQGLEYILAHDDRPVIRVGCPKGITLLHFNRNILKASDRERILPVDEDDYYYLTNYRDHPQDFKDSMVHEIVICNSGIMRVYQLK